MSLSSTSIEVLHDLIVNRLALMSIGDQDDLREQIVLKRALAEIQGGEMAIAGQTHGDIIPRRGRRRKIAGSASDEAF